MLIVVILIIIPLEILCITWTFQISENQTACNWCMQCPLKEVDLLMIGKTGNGKSSLGNSILNRNAFEFNNSTTSVTKEVSFEKSEINRRIIKVVDTPGVGDTHLDEENAIKFIIEWLSWAVVENARGYHAFLLVVKLGQRFTKEEQVTVDVLKKVFGPKFLSKFCIIVMTCGDQFEKNLSFKSWLLEQRGSPLDNLIQECNNRIVLFDNKTEDESKKNMQFNELMKIIDDLVSENGRYSNDEFEIAKLARETIILESKKDFIVDEVMNEANLIQQAFENIQDDKGEHEVNICLNTLKERAISLRDKVKQDDNNTGILTEMINHVSSMLNAIEFEILLLERTRNLQKDNLHIKEVYARDVQRLRKEFNDCYLEDKVRGKKDAMMAEEKWKKEKAELELKTKQLQEEKEKLYRQLKKIENSKKKCFFSKVQSKIFKRFESKVNLKKTNNHIYDEIHE